MKKIVFVLVIVSGIMLSSCYEEPSPGTGIVKVVDINYLRIPGADVTLSQPGNGTGYIVNYGLTNMYGEYSYTHEPALEVILNIDVTSSAGSGTEIIRITPGETTTKTVMIY